MADHENRQLSDEQVEQIRRVDPDSIWRIPDGSYFLVNYGGPGRTRRIEVCDPEARGTLVWDFGPEGA